MKMIQHNVQTINSVLFYLDIATKLIPAGTCPNQTQIDYYFFSSALTEFGYSSISKHGYGTNIGISVSTPNHIQACPECKKSIYFTFNIRNLNSLPFIRPSLL